MLLIAAAILILVGDITFDESKRREFFVFSLALVVAATVIGFFPSDSGSIFGGMYHTGYSQILMKNILNVATVIILLQSWGWLGKPNQRERIGEFFLLVVSTLIGLGYMISAGHFLMFYVGLELATIPVAALAAYEYLSKKSAEAGIKFILLAAFASSILLFGLTFIYADSGTLYFKDIITVSGDGILQSLGLILFLVGISFKISLVPFHLWTADVYEGAPVNVTSYLSVVSKGGAIFILVIVLNTVFSNLNDIWDPLLYSIVILTITLGNLFALRQGNIKRFLAFSSIAQAGFIMLGMLNNSSLGVATVIYFILIYAFSNLGAFGVVAAIISKTGCESIDDYKGLYTTNPKLSLVMMLSLFSLAGIPPVAGFFGKFFLFAAAAEKGYYILVLIAVLNTIISLYYYLLIIKAMFVDKNESPIVYFKSDRPMKLGLVICVLGMVIIGFVGPLFDIFIEVSESIFSFLN